ncbi:MAG: magnesium transporter [Alphaproteobacteria bacterium]|nr:magnesium transporter [Alphaproteobacteria bacterium]
MAETPDIEKHAEDGPLYTLPEGLVARVSAALEEERNEIVRRLVAHLPPVEMAELLDQLESDQRRALTTLLGENLDPQVLTEVAPELREEMIDELGVEHSAAAIAKLDTDEAVYVIEDLEEEEQKEILAAIPDEETRAELTELLAYPDSSAGRLMRKKYVSVPEYWSVGDTIDYMRNAEELPEEFYEIFVVDPQFRPIGSALVSKVLRSQRKESIRDIITDDMKPFAADTDQEEVARIFQKYGLVEAPVVSSSGRLLGVITVHDVVEIMHEEAEEDILYLGGVHEDDFYSAFTKTVRQRFPWLFINLLTALLASSMVGLFQDTITHLVTLAVLMPIVASIGGNAGIQTMTVMVRALATRELTRSNLWRSVGKEVMVGFTNGVLFCVITAAAIALIYNNVKLGLVFGAALLANIFLAGLVGVGVPLTAQKLKGDPAVMSSVFVTAMTDMAGFFIFLGLATFILLG